VILGSLIVLVAGAGLCLFGSRGVGLYLLVLGAIALLGTLFERWRYRTSERRDAQWQRTGERFEDPTTGRPVEVFFDPASGERRYSSDDSPRGD
jgi:hypothetical protein